MCCTAASGRPARVKVWPFAACLLLSLSSTFLSVFTVPIKNKAIKSPLPVPKSPLSFDWPSSGSPLRGNDLIRKSDSERKQTRKLSVAYFYINFMLIQMFTSVFAPLILSTLSTKQNKDDRICIFSAAV